MARTGIVHREDGGRDGRHWYRPTVLDVLIVAGARPNFMKVKPVLDAVEDLGLSTLLMHTGQH